MTTTPGFPAVPLTGESVPHRRQIVEVVNRINGGKFNATVDLTLNASQTTTTLTDPRIGYGTVVCPAMAETANAAAAIAAGIWINGVAKGSCTVNHASAAHSDQTIRFLIIG